MALPLFEICAKVGDAGSGGGLNLAETIAELDPFDDLGQLRLRLTAQTRGLINAQTPAWMKPDAARGEHRPG